MFPGVDNILAELVKCGGEAGVKGLTTLCQKVLEEKRWLKE